MTQPRFTGVLGSPFTQPGQALPGTPLPALIAVNERSVPISVALSTGVFVALTGSATGHASTTAALSATRRRSVPLSGLVSLGFVQPDSDVSIDDWTNQTGGPATYPDVSEPTPDDTTYIVSPAIPSGSSTPIVFGLPPMVDPGVGTPLEMRVRAGAVPGETTTARLRIDLLDADAIQVGTQAVIVPTGAFDWVTFIFTSAESDAYRAGDGFALGGQIRLTAEVP